MAKGKYKHKKQKKSAPGNDIDVGEVTKKEVLGSLKKIVKVVWSEMDT